jgi:hypothetical protein
MPAHVSFEVILPSYQGGSMNASDIIAGRSYRGCNGITYTVEKVEDRIVFYRTNGKGTLVSFELEAFASLMVKEIKP